MLGTSDAWSMIHLSQQTSEPAYYIADWRIYDDILWSREYTAGWNVWGEWFLAVNHHNHKNWVPSILTHNLWLIFNSTNPRTNKWNFHKKILRIGDFEKWPFFESAILNFFFSKKIKIASSPWKLVTDYVLEWMGVNFYDYDNLQPKITPPKHFSQ